MVFIVLEDKSNHVNSYYATILDRFPASVTVHVYDNKFEADKLQAYLQKPLLFKAWLIILESIKFEVGQVKELSAAGNLVVYRVQSRAEASRLAERLGDIQFVVHDNLRVAMEDIVGHVQKEINCDYAVAKLVYNRCNGYLPAIENSIIILKQLDSVNADVVRRYIPYRSRVRSFNVVEYLMVGPRCGYKYSEIVRYVYDYNNAFKWLLNTLISALKLYIKVYMLEADGSLSLRNYRSFLKLTNDSDLKQISEYKVMKILEMHESVSLEYLYYTLNYLESIPETHFGVYKLITLLKVA